MNAKRFVLSDLHAGHCVLRRFALLLLAWFAVSGLTSAASPEGDLAKCWLARPAQTEPKILAWAKAHPELVSLDALKTRGRSHGLRGDGDQPEDRRGRQTRCLLVAQPHAHEPAATAGMMDFLAQLLDGAELSGRAHEPRPPADPRPHGVELHPRRQPGRPGPRTGRVVGRQEVHQQGVLELRLWPGERRAHGPSRGALERASARARTDRVCLREDQRPRIRGAQPGHGVQLLPPDPPAARASRLRADSRPAPDGVRAVGSQTA